MSHPSSLDLEAFACGDELARVATHLEGCAACRDFVDRARALAGVGLPMGDVERLVARAERAPDGAAASRGRRPWLVTSSVVAPLAAAAAVFLLARSGPPAAPAPEGPGLAAPAAAPGDPPSRASATEPETTFKGMIPLAVVRERGSAQSRFSRVVKVRPGDRIRIEVALDREQTILGAVLSDDGSYLELMPATVRGSGTHYSERSARIDSSPTSGTIVVGPPEAVALARATRRLEGVSTMRVELEAGGSP